MAVDHDGGLAGSGGGCDIALTESSRVLNLNPAGHAFSIFKTSTQPRHEPASWLFIEYLPTRTSKLAMIYIVIHSHDKRLVGQMEDSPDRYAIFLQPSCA